MGNNNCDYSVKISAYVTACSTGDFSRTGGVDESVRAVHEHVFSARCEDCFRQATTQAQNMGLGRDSKFQENVAYLSKVSRA